MTSNKPTEEIPGLNPSVVDELPPGCQILSIKAHGSSFFAETRRINVQLADGTLASFFIKILRDSPDHGHSSRDMVRAEFESMKALYAVEPNFVPRPIAYGTYQDTPESVYGSDNDTGTHFFLSEYREIRHEMPEPRELGSRLASLHRDSRSPNGKFGFHVTTYSGNLPQMTDWDESWEIFFAKSLRKALDIEIETKGRDEKMDNLIPMLFERVVPRLLRPLENDDRGVKPSLVHGDLWYANSGLDAETGEPVVFDACCFYAHNEYEFGQWRPACNRFGPEYLTAYHEHTPKSPPEEDYEGRLDLYKLRFNTHVSALFPDNRALRDQVLGDMKDLVKRYG